MTSSREPLFEAELARLDITALLRYGLAEPGGDAHRRLFGEGAVGAAIILDQLGTIPRSLTYLAETIRAGGVRYGAELAQPLPEPAQANAVRSWLSQAAAVTSSVDSDEQTARWLEAVATIIAVRNISRSQGSSR